MWSGVGTAGLDGKNAARHVGVFEQMFQLRRIEVWTRNRLARVMKTPKLQFIDAGLLSALLDLARTRSATTALDSAACSRPSSSQNC